MAPSRAALRITSAFAQPKFRPAARLLSTHTTQTPRIHSLSALRRGPTRHPCFPVTCMRAYSQSASTTLEPPDYLNEAELHVFNKIKAELDPVKLEVQDISGGCGSMYALEIESPKFKGLTVIKQHKMVNAVLKDEIKSWHGVQLRTKAC
ncbi:bola-like protein [Plenodomus tracheiphilus IPT5]|uniref:Bola-like protein n=1 Tax=Plenodomus tracheiphilus IPT5 TaxID=1408161 RepID=A0A6A7AT40_9PLEO|nr:bola-like protein [Plenodomus tracheiphilus IPT5]